MLLLLVLTDQEDHVDKINTEPGHQQPSRTTQTPDNLNSEVNNFN